MIISIEPTNIAAQIILFDDQFGAAAVADRVLSPLWDKVSSYGTKNQGVESMFEHYLTNQDTVKLLIIDLNMPRGEKYKDRTEKSDKILVELIEQHCIDNQ